MIDLELGCRALLVVVLGAAVAGKLRRQAFESFTVSLRAFGVPAAVAGAPVAALVVALEGVAAVLLIVAPAAGYALALALIAAFTAVLHRVVHSGRRVACWCFGASTTPVGVSHLVRNASLLVAAGLGIAAGALADGEAVALPIRLVALACGALAGAAIARWDDLAYVVGPVLAGRRR
jgi:hypothetical protein